MMPRRPLPADKALRRLQSLCARAEHCTAEAQVKLSQWLVPDEEAARIIADLVANRYIDDRRFAHAYAHDRLLYGHVGRRSIRVALLQKHIDPQTIAEALAALDAQQYNDVLHDLLKMRVDRLSPEKRMHPAAVAQLVQYAVGRGFEPDCAQRLAQQLLQQF